MIRINNPALKFLLAYWQKHCQLDAWHIDWARRNMRVLDSPPKGTLLYLAGDRQRNVYFVVRGLLAAVTYKKGEKRRIISVATPNMVLMTTSHLHTGTASQANIEVIRSNSLIVEIPHKALLAFEKLEPQFTTMINILTNKYNQQMTTLRLIDDDDKQEVYRRFVKHMPELHCLLTNQEAAELLGISPDTIKRARKSP